MKENKIKMTWKDGQEFNVHSLEWKADCIVAVIVVPAFNGNEQREVSIAMGLNAIAKIEA